MLNRLTTKLAVFVLPIVLSGCLTEFKSCGVINSEIREVCIPTSNLLLNSNGGDLNIAIEIASMVENTKTLFKCKSACVIIASKGLHRQACQRTKFGLHQSDIPEGTQAALSFLASDPRIDMDAVNSIVLNHVFDDIYSFDSYEAKAMGLVDEVIDCSENISSN